MQAHACAHAHAISAGGELGPEELESFQSALRDFKDMAGALETVLRSRAAYRWVHTGAYKIIFSIFNELIYTQRVGGDWATSKAVLNCSCCRCLFLTAVQLSRSLQAYRLVSITGDGFPLGHSSVLPALKRPSVPGTILNIFLFICW